MTPNRRHENFIKENAFAKAGDMVADNLFRVIDNQVECGAWAGAIDLLGQYFEWRLRGAQEPAEGCDNRAFILQDRVAHEMKGGK